MPGIGLYCSYDRISADQMRTLRGASKLMEANDRYSTQEIYAGNHIYLSFTAYPQYPSVNIETEGRLIFVEGAIYGKTQIALRKELSELAESLFNENDGDSSSSLREWLLSSDGEYVLVFIDKSSGRLVVVNDSMGRLPLFFSERSDSISISREQKFIIRASARSKLDPLGIAEYLVFGFNLAGRTMTDGVTRFEPATMVRFLPSRRSMDMRTLHEWVFGDDVDQKSDVTEHARNLADRFIVATRNRIDAFPSFTPLLGLSGGLDSRAVLAGLLRTGVEFSAHTNLRSVRRSSGDMSVAEELVKVMVCDWRPYILPPETLGAFIEVVRNQDGANSSIMAVALESFKLLGQDYGYDTLYFTGDGGGNVMYPVLPSKALTSIDDLVKITALTTHEFHPRVASRLLRIGSADLIDAIGTALENFPEANYDWKYGHYKIFGRAFRFIMEGEDRVRFYFWLGAPFWDIDILRLTMSIPNDYKNRFTLYTEFLKCLDPRTLQVPYANIKTRPTSVAASLYDTLKTAVTRRPFLYRIARRLRSTKTGRHSTHADLDSYIDQVVSRSELLPECLDMDLLKKLRAGKLSSIMYHQLNTIILRMHLTEMEYGKDL